MTLRALTISIAFLMYATLTGCAGYESNNAKAETSASCKAGAALGTSPAGLSQVRLCIASGKAIRAYTTEVAATAQEQAMGLMFRKELADNEGMIFPFEPPRPASFWMKNTLIPLDIIFIRSNGTIESIAENTVPYSEVPVSSGEEVAAVLELRGGITSQLGIKAGDRVQWK
jgi:uncharacterized protein